jgi:hypothetical protein
LALASWVISNFPLKGAVLEEWHAIRTHVDYQQSTA